jgi:hypothetical protein
LQEARSLSPPWLWQALQTSTFVSKGVFELLILKGTLYLVILFARHPMQTAQEKRLEELMLSKVS